MQNQLLPFRQPIKASVSLPGSKSLSNRALLIAACAKGTSVIENVPVNQDVSAAIDALKALGISFAYDRQKAVIQIEGCQGQFPRRKARIFCNEAGTLTRFIIPLCAGQCEGEYLIDAAPRMRERPIQDQLEVLDALGMKAEYTSRFKHLPMTIYAVGLCSRQVQVRGEKSSQFLSGLLMAAPLIENGLSIESWVEHRQPYVDMTVKVMGDFGVCVRKNDRIYQVLGKQSYQACRYRIEPDVSTASYFWALAAISGGEVKVCGISRASIQGDIRFLEVLEKMGCVVIEEQSSITVKRTGSLKGVTVNMRNFSDTFMTLAAIASFADSDTRITGLAHTKAQESDRLRAMSDGLKRLGIAVTADGDSIDICPQQSCLKAGVVESCNDHRIAMSLALLGLVQDGVWINGAECVSKTCPDYFERINKIVQQSRL